MMRCFLLVVSLLLAETSVSGSIQNLFLDYAEGFFPDYISEDEISMEFVGDSSEEYWTPGETGYGFQHADKADFAPFMISDSNFYDGNGDPVTLLETSGDEASDIALLASGCPSSGKLGARDGKLQCPPPEAARTREQNIPVPKLPLLGEFMDMVAPPAFTQEDHRCPPSKPYYLCCDCNGWADFGLCTDCSPYNIIVGCYTPYTEVCCETYGRHEQSPGWITFDDWKMQDEAEAETRGDDSQSAQWCIPVTQLI